MRKLTKEQKRDIQVIAAKKLIFQVSRRFTNGTASKSASSIGQRRSPSRCVLIPMCSHGSKPMVEVTRPKRIGSCDTPWFSTRKKRVLESARDFAGNLGNRKEKPDNAHRTKFKGSRIAKTNSGKFLRFF